MKNKLFLDTNVVLDLLGERIPFYHSIARIATLADKNEIQLVVSALTISTLFYVLSKFENKEAVKEKIRKLKVLVETADLTDKEIEKALSSEFPDFEDALQYYFALQKECKILITRNAKDFKLSDIPVLSPIEYLSSLKLL
jgi:predicted nucleic acid-binding protein